MKFTVEAVCISEKKGEQKHPVDYLQLIENFGIENDAHAGDWHRQVSLLASEAIEAMKSEGLELKPGAFGENIITRGLDWNQTKIGDHLRIGNVELEVTQIGKKCHTPCTIFYTAGRCIMPESGIFAKVIKGGIIHAKSSGHYGIR